VTYSRADKNGVALTSGGGTLVLRGAWPKVAAGGADAYDDGSSTYLAYHYYDANNSGRETLDIRQVTFANGWPILAAPLGSANNHLLNGQSNLCADVWLASTADGAAVNQGTCNSGANQQWVLTPVGSNYQLVSVNSGKCLAISQGSTTPGAAAVQSTCDSSPGKLWTKAATIGGYVTFTNVNSGQCLEVYGAVNTNGAGMNQWLCNGGANQQWLIV
jgi:arabinan endo-1,5-alpha-L-arabinosidase